MYAFVDVEQYQIVGTGATIDEAQKSYRQALNLEKLTVEAPEESRKVSGTVDNIASAVVSGNTCYYFTLKGSNDVYTAFISVSEQLPFLSAGDQVELTFVESENGQTMDVQELLRTARKTVPEAAAPLPADSAPTGESN